MIAEELNELNVYIAAVIASKDDEYRKPKIGMWTIFQEKVNKKVEVDLNNSIYCGDKGLNFSLFLIVNSWKKK